MTPTVTPATEGVTPEAAAMSGDSPLRGITCPDCRHPRLMVVTVRRVCAGRVWRQRRCPVCRASVSTVEQVIYRPAKNCPNA